MSLYFEMGRDVVRRALPNGLVVLCKSCGRESKGRSKYCSNQCATSAKQRQWREYSKRKA